MNKRNKGFTLAELLVVVAIIAVLVAIAIPVFSTQLEKAREATDLANIRSAYAEAMSSLITNDTNVNNGIKLDSSVTNDDYYQLIDNPNVYFCSDDGGYPTYMAIVEVTQTKNGWQISDAAESIKSLNMNDNSETGLDTTIKYLEYYKNYEANGYIVIYKIMCSVEKDNNNPFLYTRIFLDVMSDN